MNVELKCPDCQMPLLLMKDVKHFPHIGRHESEWLECPECGATFTAEINIKRILRNVEIKMSIGPVT